MKNTTLLFIISFISSNLIGQAPTFTTHSFSAQIQDSRNVDAEVGSCMDNNLYTHIAWIKDTGNDRYLMYTVFNPYTQTFTHQQINAGSSTEHKFAPYIITDGNDNPHIVYMIERDPNASNFNNGNQAIMYAGDGDGDGTWEVLQVSTNDLTPTNDVDGLYNCYFDDRPSIFLNPNDDIIVAYLADDNNLTNNEKYIIFAEKNGSSWTHTQHFSVENTSFWGGTYIIKEGIAYPKHVNGQVHGGYTESNVYKVNFVYHNGTNWQTHEIPGYQDAAFANEHIQLADDIDGDVHYMWFNDKNNKFCHTQLLGGTSYSSIDETPTVQSNPSGHFYPATIDVTTYYPVYFYKQSFGDSYFITFDQSFNAIETMVPSNTIGTPYGRKSLFAADDYITLTTADESDQKIYVTHTEDIVSVRENDKQKNTIYIYPNPASNYIQFQTKYDIDGAIKIKDVSGKVVYESSYSGYSKNLNIEHLSKGMYFLSLITKNSSKNESVITRKIIIE